MDGGVHHETLVKEHPDNPEIYGNVTLLYVDDTLIGSMKMCRDRSILGLRTIQDSKDRYPIVTGGVYVTTKEITKQAEETHKEQGKWARLYLDKLLLFPMEIVLKEEGFERVREYATTLKGIRERLEK